MTQEELDALMAEGLDDDNSEDTNDQKVLDESSQIDEIKDTQDEPLEKIEEIKPLDEISPTKEENQNYRVSSTSAWPPPPPTDDHKMVRQLDDVTKDSEEKATEMFDKLETINNFFMDAENLCNEAKDVASKNIEVFEKLCAKFPNVDTFSSSLEQNQNMLNNIDDVISNLQMGQDEVMMTMDMMQYQDIHRQKIERVINVMRALSKYMNSLFEGKVEDEKRVSSAVHIEGDTTTENIVSNEDIEALIESLGKK
ncbi:hypothetical protein CIG2463D_0734 [Campylobacter iguaniorum]|uniref:Chemotaxis protein n=1 Tax=Campylobacter iguaniorum TaxID=1244531 RepID=A0A076FFE5_9BACT|nr:hypothetical protein [Campylobacter iguaniorum]AII14579.1 hypothetical protein CIG1485E_0733 [Campylobacter iguaniorum]ALV24314.1 hypothetical protein CIG2463D_0734 [Campylobacter iguaniorum]